MLETKDRFFECQYCGMPINFYFNYTKNKYVSLCPYCNNRLEMEINEYERKNEEGYFEPDF